MKIDEATSSFAPTTSERPRGRRKSSYIWGLDLIRFAAAAMVVLFHLSWKNEDPDLGFAAGWVGVEIFFVISGFVIMGSASATNVATFARRRFARLYPAAIVCAFINLTVLLPYADLARTYGLVVSAEPSAFIGSLLLLHSPFLVGSLWTLPVEIGFYVLIALMIRYGLIERPARIASALIAWSSLYLIPFCLSEYELLPFPVRPLGYGVLNLTMLRHGCFFGVGILLWAIANKDSALRTRRLYAMLSLGIVLCWVEIVARVAELRTEYGHPIDMSLLTTGALGAFSVAVLAMAFFSRLNEALRPGTKTLTVTRYLGLVTYPLYLMHEGVGGVTSSLLLANGQDQGVALLAGLSLSLAASAVVVIIFEPWLEPRLTMGARWIVFRIGSALRVAS